MFGKKYSISLLDEQWKVVRNNIKVSVVPQQGDFIYLEDKNSYYTVSNVVHYLNDKQGIFLVVKIHSQKI